MKELTIEQKAKRYDEALERAKSFELPEYKNIMVSVFPELAESEDEKTRKALISFLKSPFVNENITDEKVTPWIAWLEKQKEPELSKDLGDYIAELSKQFPEVSFAKLSRIAIRVKNWFEKQGEQNPTDKIVLKFKLGDWVTNGIETVQITGYDIDYGYQVDYKGKLQHRDTDIIEKEYHLWTIQDVKPDDVLVINWDNGYKKELKNVEDEPEDCK